jgi:multiple sugar transport system substrate-binding protein
MIDADFMKAFPNVTVTGEYLNTNTDFFPKIQTTLAAHNPPEFVPRSAFARVVTLASLGVLEPLNDVLDAIGTTDFVPGSLDQYKSGSDYFGLPLDKVTIAFWYRTDLAQQASLKLPTTWDELLAFAKALTTGGMYGFTLPYGRTALTNQYLFVLLRQNGGNIVDPDLNVVFDSPATVQAVEFMAELAQYSPPASASYGSPEVVTSFTSGQSASTCSGG